jgi:hypothetical protein
MRNKKKRRGPWTQSKKRGGLVAWSRVTAPKELVLASRRIGDSAVKRLKWLVSFAELELGGLSQGQLSDLGWELNAFLFPPGELAVIENTSNRTSLTTLALVDHGESLGYAKLSIEKCHAFLRNGIESAFHGGWEFTYPKRTEKISLIANPEEVVVGPTFDILSLDTVFEMVVFDLLKSEADRLGLCANERCRKPFVTEKKNKGRFCSPRCSAYVRVARFREKR